GWLRGCGRIRGPVEALRRRKLLRVVRGAQAPALGRRIDAATLDELPPLVRHALQVAVHRRAGLAAGLARSPALRAGLARLTDLLELGKRGCRDSSAAAPHTQGQGAEDARDREAAAPARHSPT